MHSIVTILLMSFIALFFAVDSSTQLFTIEITEPDMLPVPSLSKKKIVIFTFNKGGYGHKAASKALNELLKTQYEINTIDLSEYLGAGRIVGGWSIYDTLLRGGWIRSTNIIAGSFPLYMKVFEKRFKKKVCRLLDEENPDLVISVISYFDGLLFHACKQLDLPLLMVTTDGDLANWTVGLDAKTQPKIKATIGFESPKTRGLLLKHGLSDEDIALTGFPIRKDFLEKKDKNTIKTAWNIPQDKFTVLLLMGGVGVGATYNYARKISKMNLPIHLVVCTGSNKSMYKRMQKIQRRSNVSMTVVPFTQRVSDLMAVSDLLITKAGPGTINEAVFMDLPMLVDKTTSLVYWEEENIKFVEQNNFGQSVLSFRRLENTIKKFVEDKQFYMSFKQSLVQYPKQDFDSKITHLVQELCPLSPDRHDHEDVCRQSL